MHRTRDKTGGVRVKQLPLKLGVRYRQFLNKNFKQYLIICSPSVKHVWELKGVISSTHSNMRKVIWGNVDSKLAVRLGSVLYWPPCISGEDCARHKPLRGGTTKSLDVVLKAKCRFLAKLPSTHSQTSSLTYPATQSIPKTLYVNREAYIWR